jgi:hypothetical protein
MRNLAAAFDCCACIVHLCIPLLQDE